MKFWLGTIAAPLLFIGLHSFGQNHINHLDAPDMPVIFAPGLISTGLNERDFAMMPDGSEIIYTLANHNNKRRMLVSVKIEDGVFQTPTVLPFSGVHNDIEPFFHPNGRILYFASNRPLAGHEKANYNIFMSERVDDTWTEAVALHPRINSMEDEFYPSITLSNTIYFTSTREGGAGKEDIWKSQFIDGDYQTPTVLDTAVNSDTYDFNAYVSPDESIIIFSSYGRADDLGGGDLYMSQKDATGRWQKAVHFGADINSKFLDYCPFLDVENNIFYFTSQRTSEMQLHTDTYQAFKKYLNCSGNGMGDIYYMDAKLLKLK